MDRHRRLSIHAVRYATPGPVYLPSWRRALVISGRALSAAPVCAGLLDRFSGSVPDIFAFDEIEHLLTDVRRMVGNALQRLRGENQTNAPRDDVRVCGPLFKKVTKSLGVHRIDLIVQPNHSPCFVDILVLKGS